VKLQVVKSFLITVKLQVVKSLLNTVNLLESCWKLAKHSEIAWKLLEAC